MKKILSAAICLALFSAAAYASSGEVLSIQTIQEGNIAVELPTVKLADGSICVSYLSSASRDEKSGKIFTEVSRVCGQPATTGATTPANLKAMGSFASGDLTIQTPTLAADASTSALLVNAAVMSPAATVTLQAACTTNGSISSQIDGSLVYCKDHKWTARGASYGAGSPGLMGLVD
jgi:hypothetical protein